MGCINCFSDDNYNLFYFIKNLDKIKIYIYSIYDHSNISNNFLYNYNSNLSLLFHARKFTNWYKLEPTILKKKPFNKKIKKIQLICHGICQHAIRLKRVQTTAPSNCIAWLIRMYKKILVFFSLSVLFYTLTIAVYYIIFFSTPYKVSNI